ncbi:MAG: Hpt domain-containing protein, partial [Gammaproteobacteria bacterium]
LEEAADRLLGIFADEAAEHLAELEAWLASAPEPRVGDRTMRSVHTLKGSARVAGVTPLAGLMEPLDALVRAAAAVSRAPTAGERALLESSCALLRDLVGTRMQVGPSLADRAATLREEALALVAESAVQRPSAAADEARLARFLEEALEKLFHATNLLDAWRAGSEPEANRAALRAELLAIAQRTEQLGLQSLLPLATALLAAALRASGESGLDCLKQGVEAFLDALDRLAADQQPEVPTAVVAALHDIAAQEPEPAPAPVPVPVQADAAPEAALLRNRIARDLQQAEEDLLGIFLEEAEELMAAIDQDIDDWRHDRANRGPFERLQRSLHTLKGGARMAGLKTLGELSHHFETFLINQSVQFGSFDDPF